MFKFLFSFVLCHGVVFKKVSLFKIIFANSFLIGLVFSVYYSFNFKEIKNDVIFRFSKTRCDLPVMSGKLREKPGKKHGG